MSTEAEIAKLLLKEEDSLSPFARRSSATLGRKSTLKRDPFRLDFARDETRILHSPPFRRLKHKTQVFLSPHNDHICTRMEHVLHVSSIAAIIGRCLKLNTDLINAIAKGHDLGHPPFGHAGERALDEICRKCGAPEGFKHEIHGLRVVDKLTNYGSGLNLTYEVRDGIISHCGEKFEQSVAPDRVRDLLKLEEIVDRTCYPTTLEGCLVRVVDRIAYLGRDLEDGIKAGLVKKSDVPSEIAKNLGVDNGKIIGVFVNDVIRQSFGRDIIGMSDEIFGYMDLLKKFNYEHIYLHPEVARRTRQSDHIVGTLFNELLVVLDASAMGSNMPYVEAMEKESATLATFFHFIKNFNYIESTEPWRIVADYVAGMTDVFAQRTYAELFLPTPVV